ncbi:MAG: 23S rRNA (pseudouridine(1915)-N(3))-methyltransferase RlmH [Paludibacteraceae bacterium]|nr:23S rRNA (pseudouridine(1915)-N(3))-methyltransferase RlmH [Paludibacteraceae bacterium]
MKTILLLTGKTTDELVNQLIQQYVARLKFYLDFELQVIPEIKNTKHLSEQQQKQKEAELQLKALEGADEVVLLDERGRSYRSVEFADQIGRYQNAGRRKVVFVIGGPYGFAPEVYQRATAQLSLSSMTFSHQLVRVLFVEQLYRAMTILKGEPYHHE